MGSIRIAQWVRMAGELRGSMHSKLERLEPAQQGGLSSNSDFNV